MTDWSQAIVSESKILGYLLNLRHPVGRSKAEFFASAGYRRAEWTILRDHLVALATSGDLVAEQKTRFGVKYVIDGVLEPPGGRPVVVRTVWITDRSDQPPRLVTAYPR